MQGSNFILAKAGSTNIGTDSCGGVKPGSIVPATELEAVDPVEELAELTMLALLLLAPLTPPVLALLWLLLFQPSLVLLARCLGLCSLM